MRKMISILLPVLLCFCFASSANATATYAGIHTRVNISYLNSLGMFIGGIPSVSDSDYVVGTGNAHVSVNAAGTCSETVYSGWDAYASDEEMGFDGTESGYGLSVTHLRASYYAEKNVTMRLSWDFD